jgi:hypothetical protein
MSGTEKKNLAERLLAIADELAMLAKKGGADMTKDEIAAMWSQLPPQEEE